MKRIKLLHVLTTTAGGLGQSVLSLVEQLDPERFEVTVAFGPGYPLDRKFIDRGIRVVPVRMKRGLKLINLAGLWDLYRLMRAERFDLLHAHSSVAGFLARLAARFAGVPAVLFTLHGYASIDYQHPLSRRFLGFLEKVLDRWTDYYVAVSRHVEQLWLQRGIVSPDRVSVIYHGIDFKSARRAADPALKKMSLGLPEEGPIVGTVGLLEAQKGTEYFIRAIPLILPSFPTAHFLVIGNGPLQGRLKELAEELGISRAIHFLGWRDDAAELIGTMDLFCLPSLRESLGLVLLEAMAHAKPIVATRVEGVPEVVVDGETGLLVPPKDPTSLAKGVLSLLARWDAAMEMGKRGKARLMEKFDAAEMGRQYESLYLRLCGKSGRGKG
jgi:glycosyltransferase involved in cell wall biosynthesis